ncbi:MULTISPECIES: acyl-CoA dehydrogenase [unclassified Paracoccus (in: a-proteobacteria)]|uniref:acyl-CoA dehydrogenase n=1 Tax=unclassified Paracoccus (in: a-proteobacteria) TaxID=2688777 RepID=UPI0012B19447|nr:MULTISPECIES: acyl-CoA dehydrogenase [unclassified Paracoccus (in: a-proteobacteria)]UXU75455.1 acyl-CoA dehydrogenase [Paracoccus sp. SMMA_5]UXU81360.1 acyl-CoA dehydrogenase [Paracoccus sp. SMMA_5_TC]
MGYQAPIEQIGFILRHVVSFPDLAATERFAEASDDTLTAILAEAGKLASEVIAPVNRAGDLTPARLENGKLRSSPGFADAFRAMADGGWIGLAAPQEYGGMGLPQALNMAVNEMMASACLALQLNPLLTQGQIEALEHHGSETLKALYLPKLISGEWSGTMNLTEPQAGSDVGALTTRAERSDDGSYRITGQKIFITWGDSDVTENVCHLVLARLPDGGPGTRGISLFMVPKLIPDAAGRPGLANNLRVVSLEHKLGIHGSPTCVMSFEGAQGWLVGEEHKGMAAMFTMMNCARLGVGVQGVAQAEAALQQAVAYARDRNQMGPIIRHPDVRRMLAESRAEVFAARAICLACAMALDMARATGSEEWAARAALLTPIAKAHGTDVGVRVCDTAVQVHGGMGYVEETGIAQFLRDVRITPIYEGTNGIQAMDLVGRKLADGGQAAMALLDEILDGAKAAQAAQPDLAHQLWQAAETLREATQELLGRDMAERFAGAVPYLSAFARVLGAHYHLRAAIQGGSAVLARLYITRILPHYAADLAAAQAGLAGLESLDEDALLGQMAG